MDNFHFDMTAEGPEALAAAIKIVFQICGCDGTTPRGDRRGVTHYAIRQAVEGECGEDRRWKYGKEPRPTRLIFFNHYNLKDVDGDKVALAFKMDAEASSEFARRWLEQTEYSNEPDHDGSNGKGWRLYNEDWGHIDDDHYAVIAIAPVWAMHGK